MGKFYCTKCGKEIKPINKYKDKDGIVQSELPKNCPLCGSTSIEYMTT